jgi:hypothetical protein
MPPELLSRFRRNISSGGSIIMKRLAVVVFVALALALGFPAGAFAQNGHFVRTQTCVDQGTTLLCSGKVAGLGGTTFEIKVAANGIATVECTNPGGNVAPGQTFETATEGSSGPLPTPRNGQFRYSISTETPDAPADSCPNAQWTPEVVDVEFGDATITLLEDGVVSDTATVPVS